ncbi:proteasome assembly chaperone family protein [Candidatus Methanocrinis natronophilus]|uniref:Proteasome assembly chaperone family protein n=1 Tax=Candidatus Methanocrinis natronophilus TaxID=3033396 RepID=A0ABT5X6E0_9EURY|nr:proteasome assembly chaperone family protein [Candidatus Methanocrinis natronophilus]MDF0590242.1 proteasome assembly chaperone family protein [Candidatus Methanocrinis natronophilus]
MTDEVQVRAETPQSENPVVIEGFPGIGLIGNIASQYVINKLEMDYLGAIDSRFFPPMSVLVGGLAHMPVRIYEKSELGVVVVSSDIPVHPAASYDLARGMVSWAESIGATEMVCLAGITVMGEEQRVFGAATTGEMLNKIKDKVEVFEFGTISGISGSVMNQCLLRKMPAICLLGETHSMAPDPRAAVVTIKMLNNLYSLNVDTTELEERADEIEFQMQKLAEQVQSSSVEEVAGRKELQFPMYG